MRPSTRRQKLTRAIGAALVLTILAVGVSATDATAGDRNEDTAVLRKPVRTPQEKPVDPGTEDPADTGTQQDGATLNSDIGDYETHQPTSGSPFVVPPVSIDVDASGFGATNTPPAQTTFDHATGWVSEADGCAINCIVSTGVHPTVDPTVMEVAIVTTVAAEITLWMPAGPPGDPQTQVQGLASAAADDHPTTVTTLELTDLEPGTTQTLVVRATDLDGGQWWDVGSFDVPEVPDLTITIESITVVHDGDVNPTNNAGELWFRWGFGPDIVGGTLEAPLNDGFSFPVDEELFIPNAGGIFGSTRVDAIEDDPNKGCGANTPAAGSGAMFPAALWGTHGPGCLNIQYNGAETGLHTLVSVQGFPLCTASQVTHPAPNLHCQVIQTQEHGGEYPLIDAVVSYEVTPHV